MTGYDLKEMDGVVIPSRLEFIPADKPDQKTIMEYLELNFDVDIPENISPHNI